METQSTDRHWKMIHESVIKDKVTMMRYYDKPMIYETQIQKYSQGFNVCL